MYSEVLYLGESWGIGDGVVRFTAVASVSPDNSNNLGSLAAIRAEAGIQGPDEKVHRRRPEAKEHRDPARGRAAPRDLHGITGGITARDTVKTASPELSPVTRAMFLDA